MIGYSPAFLTCGRIVPIAGDYYGRDTNDFVVDNEGVEQYSRNIKNLPTLYQDVAQKFRRAHNSSKNFSAKLAPKFVPARVIQKLSPLVYTFEDPETLKNLSHWHAKDLMVLPEVED